MSKLHTTLRSLAALLISGVLAGVTNLPSSAAPAPAQYRLTDVSRLWPPGYRLARSSVFINTRDEVAGNVAPPHNPHSTGPIDVFVYSGGSMRLMPHLQGSSDDDLNGLNDSGMMDVVSSSSAFYQRHFVVESGPRFLATDLYGTDYDLFRGNTVAPDGDVFGQAAIPDRNAFEPALWDASSGTKGYSYRHTFATPPEGCDDYPAAIWSVNGRDIIAGSQRQQSTVVIYTVPPSGTPPVKPCRKGEAHPSSLSDVWPMIWAPNPHRLSVGKYGAMVVALTGRGQRLYAAVNNDVCKGESHCNVELAIDAYVAPVFVKDGGVADLGARQWLPLPKGFHHLDVESLAVVPDGSLLAAGWVMRPGRNACSTSYNGLQTEAALWFNGQVRLLDSLLPYGSNDLLCQASSINSHGQIVGTGLIDGKANSVFLLKPQH